MLTCFPRETTPPMRYDELVSKYHVDYSHSGRLGTGSYGDVYKGVNKSTGKSVAIKKINDFFRSPVDVKRLFREVSLLRMLGGHPNIISLECIAIAATNGMLEEISLVFECYQTDLAKVIRSGQELSARHIQYFVYQMLCGIYSVHAAGLVHRDLKPSNILLNEDCKTVICDFGLARATKDLRGQPYSVLTEYVVTRWYRSPELLLHCPGAGAAPTDMWSIGCILAELFLRTSLFPGENELNVVDLILNLIGTPEQDDYGWINNPKSRDDVLHFPKRPRQNFQEKFIRADVDGLDLLEKLLEFNPTKRITAEQALRHPFFSERFDSKDLVTFPLKPRTLVDQRSSDSYYQFESQLETARGDLSEQITRQAARLIIEETGRYREESPQAPLVSAVSVVSAVSPMSPRDLTSAAGGASVASSTPSSLFHFKKLKDELPSADVVPSQTP